MNSFRRFRCRWAAVATLLVTAALPGAPAAGSGHEVLDSWSTPVDLRSADGGYVTSVHAALLPNGTVLMFGIRRSSWPPGPGDVIRRIGFLQTPDPYGAVLPPEQLINQLTQPVVNAYTLTANSVTMDDLICAGQTLLADGTVFTTGGTRASKVLDTGALASIGLPTQTIFDGTTWSRTGDLTAVGAAGAPGRWYPTALRLPDRRVLIIGGFDRVYPTPSANLTTEVFDPVTGQNTLASPLGVTPYEMVNSSYTHAWVLPSPNLTSDILMFGEPGFPVMNDTRDFARWEVRYDSQRPGGSGPSEWSNNGATSAMLPLRVDNGEWGYTNGSVLMAGGSMGTPFLDQFDVYDPVADSWLPSAKMPGPRHHPNAVVLPDGRIVLLGGHDVTDPQVQRATYIDPADGFSVTLGAASAGLTRGYHASSVLLPDGRVLLSGGRDWVTAGSDEKPSYQYYEPDYMTKPRPQIVQAPATLDYGGLFVTGSVGPRPAEAVLVALGSQTHSWDANQRVIELAVGAVFDHSGGGFVSILGDPVNTHQVPPGQYMLFLLDENRVPSVAKMVSVQP